MNLVKLFDSELGTDKKHDSIIDAMAKVDNEFLECQELDLKSEGYLETFFEKGNVEEPKKV